MDRSSAVLVSLGVLIGLVAGLAIGYGAFSPNKPTNYAECLLIYGRDVWTMRACSTQFPGPGIFDQRNPDIPNPARRPR